MWTNEHISPSGVLSEFAEVMMRPRQTAIEQQTLGPAPLAILGVAFDNATLTKAVERIEQMIQTREPSYVVTANVDFLVNARRDLELRRILFDAHLVLCDGAPLVWVSHVLGNPLPERVAGADITPILLQKAAEKNYRVFFLGGAPEVTAKAVQNVYRKFPNLTIAGHYSPPYRDLLEMDNEDIIRRVKEAKPDLLLVSFGCPKAEKWIAMNYRKLRVPVTIGVGGTIDFLAGTLKRAPMWVQRIGCEWLFRLLQEPRRLYQRYATDLREFSGHIIRQLGWMYKHAHAPSAETCAVLLEEPTWVRLQIPSCFNAEVVKRDASILKKWPKRHVIIEMSHVRYIDSTGLGFLMHLEKMLRASGRHLVLLDPSREVRGLLRLMGLDELLLTAADILEASQILHSMEQQLPVMLTENFPQSTLPLQWQGEITAANAHQVWELTLQRLRDVSSQQDKLLIDLSSVKFLDSAGLGVMLKARKHARQGGVDVQFVDPSPAVRNVVKIARLEPILFANSSR